MVGWRRLVSSGTPEHSVPLRLWVLASAIISTLAVTAHDDFTAHRVIISVLLVAGFGFSYWRRGKRNWWVKILLAGLCLLVAYQFLREVLGDPYHTSIPLTIFLLRLQTLHSFDVPARRDLLFSLLSSVILMAVAAVFAVDSGYLLYLGAYACAGIQAIVHNAWQAGHDAALASRKVRGAAAGRTDAAAVASIPGGTLVRAANHLLILVLAGAGVVFLLTPRFEGLRVTTLPFSAQRVLLDLFAGGIMNPAYPDSGPGDAGANGLRVWNPRGYFGFGTSVDLRLRGRLDDRVVMRVRATHQQNWRALVFDTYTGSGWRMSDEAVAEVDGSFPPIHLVTAQDEVYSYRSRSVRATQTFYIEQEQPNVLFAAPVAEALYLSTGRVFRDRYGATRLPSTLKPGTVYSVVSRLLRSDLGRLSAVAGPVPGFIRDRYLQVPAMPGRVAALARRIVEGQPTQYDRVLAVNRYLWATYPYDLTIPHQRGADDAVDYFLFEERRGYCEQFASAMVVLLRSVGIPSRLVTGYGPGILNPVTGLLEVRTSDAHAWVEVFFPEVGWVEFEPTPGFPDTADLGGPVVRRWAFQDVAEWLRNTLEQIRTRYPAAARLAALTAVPVALAGDLARQAAPWILLALVIGLGAAGAVRLGVAGERPASPREAVEDLYRQAHRLLARRGLRPASGETVAEFSRRVRARGGTDDATSLFEMFEQVAYGGVEPDADLIRSMRARVLRLRGRLGRSTRAD